MEIGRIEGATRVLGAPKNWDETSKEKCYGLPILDCLVEGIPCMVSAWKPSPEELKMLIAGESIKLWIYGNSHPVVSISVGF